MPPRATPPRPGPPPGAGCYLTYAPDLDRRADPGEVVWTQVAYEQDPLQSKDRPVLVVGRSEHHLVGLMMTTRSHEGEEGWVSVGSGSWDARGRESWLRLDRCLVIEEGAIRREGAVFPRRRFEEVAHLLREEYGWS